MELILVRHAEPAASAAGDPNAGDPPLSDAGRRQSARVAAWLADSRVDLVVSSPARRAIETAEVMAAQAGLEVQVDDRLRDAQSGRDHYVSLEADRESDPAAYRTRVEGYRASPQMDVVAERVNEALDAWCARARGGRVVAFGHGTTVNLYAARVLGLENAGFFDAGFASGHRFLVSSTGVRSVRSLNETGYLID